MATNTYTPIGSVTLATATSEVTFTVPSGYRDLVLVVNGTFSSNDYCVINLNNDTSNHTTIYMQGRSAGATSGTQASTYGYYANINSILANQRFMIVAQILDYSATDKHKTALIRTSYEADTTYAAAGRWASTNAVTSVKVRTDTGNYNIGTTMNLYGIVA